MEPLLIFEVGALIIEGNLIRKSKILIIFMGCFLFINSISIFLYASVGMKYLRHKETKIFENVVLRFDVPTEYVANDSFWWLLEGSNRIKIVNFSDEPHTGKMELQISNNPCNNVESISLDKENYTFETESENIKIPYYFSILSYGEADLDLIIKNKSKCNVKGEDKRNFGVRVSGWEIK